MKPKTVILMGVAIVCGLVAALLVSMATATNRGPDMVTVLVAAEELRQGTVLSNLPKQLHQMQMPRDAVPPNALLDPKQLEGMQVLRTLNKNQIPTLGSVGKYEGLEKRLPPGHRAMTIRVSVDSAVAGFILPGARVDLLATMADGRNSKVKKTKTFMQNMLVLAMNTTDVREEKGRTVVNPSTATLAVTPNQAERLSRVATEGVVWLVLRKPDDDKVVKTAGVTNPFDDTKAEGAEEDMDVLVAAGPIAANTEVNDANFEKLFEVKRLSKNQVPDGALTKKEEVTAKVIYHPLARGQALTQTNLTAPPKEGKKDETVIPDNKQHVLRISNGAQPVIEVVYQGTKGTLSGGQPQQPGEPAPAPGSEGK